MIKKENRLKKRKHFSYIFKNGSRISSKHITINYIKTKYKNHKIGFSVSKKIGNAVIRNKVKRRLKEIIRIEQHKINKNFNYIIVAREGIENIAYETTKKELINLLKGKKLYIED